MNPDITQHLIGLALALGISVLLGALVLLAVHIRGVTLMRRLRAKHRREWEVLHAQADAMFAQIQRRADSANQDTQ